MWNEKKSYKFNKEGNFEYYIAEINLFYYECDVWLHHHKNHHYEPIYPVSEGWVK